VFPADVILVATSERNGSAFIETSSLDGKTDYVKKRIPS